MSDILDVIVNRTDVLEIYTPGPQGPGGGAGSGGINWLQNDASDTWTIAHNLGYRPNVDIYTVGGLSMWGTVLHLSANTLQISFNDAVAGTARLV